MTAAFAHARLLLDIVSMKLFLQLCGHSDGLADSHLFFFERYSELAEYHRRHGRAAKADRLAAMAETYYQAAPGDDDDEPPKAAAIGMPVPRRTMHTNAVSTTRLKPSKKSSIKTISPR
jgi:hypothetical protein